MQLEQEILINKFGQGLVSIDEILILFDAFNSNERYVFLNDVIYFIMQSKPSESDIEPSIVQSGLKPTLTPCVLLKKGVKTDNLQRLVSLPENEWVKALTLLMNLFKIAYERRFKNEINDPNKWWYWDLSNTNNIDKILGSGKGNLPDR